MLDPTTTETCLSLGYLSVNSLAELEDGPIALPSSDEYWLPPLSRIIVEPTESLPTNSSVAERDSQTLG